MIVPVNIFRAFLFFLFICSCTVETNSPNSRDKLTESSQLDLILGDKVINEDPKKFRKDNFKELLWISKSDLKEESKIYDVSQIGSDFYLINQKKQYENARLFSLIVKTENDTISKFYTKNDFRIIDNTINHEDLIVLFGNFGYYNQEWKTNNEIELIAIDHDLKQKWIYSPSSSIYPLEAVGIENKEKYVLLQINVITGCHMCFNTFELKIDTLGNCFSAKEISKTNSSVQLDKNRIEEIFKNP